MGALLTLLLLLNYRLRHARCELHKRTKTKLLLQVNTLEAGALAEK